MNGAADEATGNSELGQLSVRLSDDGSADLERVKALTRRIAQEL
jgi:hypothetical protein